MASSTKIEWADCTWNPIVGCSVVSPACTNCYAMRMAARLEAMGVEHYRGMTQPSKAGPVWTGKVAPAPDSILTAPLRWKKPRRIFVNSMGDLFHESVSYSRIDLVFAIIATAQQHTFLILTKRADRMRRYMTDRFDTECGSDNICEVCEDLGLPMDWPQDLPNCWLGVTAEDQQRANERIPDLLATPAAVRFISAEPLLGAINLSTIDLPGGEYEIAPLGWSHLGRGENTDQRLDLVICGGETGPNARPMHPDWARKLRDDCAAAGTPFFFKGWGEWETAIDRDLDDPDWRQDYTHVHADGGTHRWASHCWLNLDGGRGFHGERFHVMRRVGKKHSGRLLDGREWNGMPEVRG